MSVSRFLKLISRKIWAAEKFCNFHTVELIYKKCNQNKWINKSKSTTDGPTQPNNTKLDQFRPKSTNSDQIGQNWTKIRPNE